MLIIINRQIVLKISIGNVNLKGNFQYNLSIIINRQIHVALKMPYKLILNCQNCKETFFSIRFETINTENNLQSFNCNVCLILLFYFRLVYTGWKSEFCRLSFSLNFHSMLQDINVKLTQIGNPQVLSHFGEKSLCMLHRLFPAKNKRQISAQWDMS